MSDLPSRDRMKPLAVSLRNGADTPDGLVEEIIVTFEARASGRLVDREAIDYEAAAKVLTNRIIGAKGEGPRRAAQEAVDAALGEET